MDGNPADCWEEHDAFLMTVHEAHDDDTPRLVYADWLEDLGGETWAAYAEFIRNQIESAKLRNRSKHRRARLAARQAELLAGHSRAWLGPWAAAPFRWAYRRGIPEFLHARATGHWLGRRLGADWGFADRAEFTEGGRVSVEYGDVNWPGMYPAVEGTYRLRFTFARVSLAVELWQVENQTLRMEGVLAEGGLRLEVRELQPRGPEAGCVKLDLKATDRWWTTPEPRKARS